MKDYRFLGKKYLLDAYADRGLTLVGGEGVYLVSDTGEKYLDLAANYGVDIFGHNHPVIGERLKAQWGRLATLHGGFGNDRRSLAAEALVKRCGLRDARVHFSSSGAEAVEAALKFAALATGKKTFIACRGGYHGKTLGALSATCNRKFRDPFDPLPWQVEHIAFGDPAPLARALESGPAAFIVEPVQGEGGVIVPASGYLAEALRLCRNRNVLMILDEVQTGVGRTGRFLASEEECGDFDILCLGKGLAGGIPVGATLVAGRIAERIPRSVHTSTFGGNPLAAEGILAVLDLLDRTMLDRVGRIGGLFMDGLKRFASRRLVEVRGRGLMIGVETAGGRDFVLKELQRRKILALPAADNVVRFLPPFGIGEDHVRQATEALDEILRIQSAACPEFCGKAAGPPGDERCAVS